MSAFSFGRLNRNWNRNRKRFWPITKIPYKLKNHNCYWIQWNRRIRMVESINLSLLDWLCDLNKLELDLLVRMFYLLVLYVTSLNPLRNFLKSTFFSVDGAWMEWSGWSACSRFCGLGEQTRNRSCANPEPKYGGSPCPNENFTVDTKSCDKSCLGKLRVESNLLSVKKKITSFIFFGSWR